jgi:sterol desaturase/sphingolipid hydroxylase (fatty acid hydroxylase superfamily)
MLAWIFAVLGLFMIVERCTPGWRLPEVRTWPWRALAINACQLAVIVIAGRTWEHAFQAASPLHLSAHMSTWPAAASAYFAATFVFYWWHRWRHESDWLWRCFHQVHHSAQRLETSTTFYKHPLEMLVNSLVNGVLIYALLGLSVEAGAAYAMLTATGEFFFHANIRTPHWIGYVYQRPEMHRIHHEHAAHRNNYGDIVWWDMLFGTYENPPAWGGRCGFDASREERLLDMLRFRDVHAAKERD